MILAYISLAFQVLGADDDIVEHFGMCDASAAMAISSDTFVVANDEDNILRIYQRDEPGAPIRGFNLDAFLAPDPKHPEADIEGAARIGERIYWITSHGANKNSKPRSSRRRFFATDVKLEEGKALLVPAGQPYLNLLSDLAACPSLKDYQLMLAATRAPKQKDALNIEGLCATPQGALLIAFRNPIPGGKALIVPMENPDEVVEGKPAKLGEPMLLALGGLGVRSIEYYEHRNQYLIIAGSYGENDEFAIYLWSGDPERAPEIVEGIDLHGLRPETLIFYPGEERRIQILSDDGTRPIDGQDCKNADPAMRCFRSGWIALPD
ncbi:DUF3616 domain-containing protein [Candidatus Sumerlaeota bacterium]|nr:DUF3616 domain-containing protein [Candidatus Sumerlaeota bacterium]